MQIGFPESEAAGETVKAGAGGIVCVDPRLHDLQLRAAFSAQTIAHIKNIDARSVQSQFGAVFHHNAGSAGAVAFQSKVTVVGADRHVHIRLDDAASGGLGGGGQLDGVYHMDRQARDMVFDIGEAVTGHRSLARSVQIEDVGLGIINDGAEVHGQALVGNLIAVHKKVIAAGGDPHAQRDLAVLAECAVHDREAGIKIDAAVLQRDAAGEAGDDSGVLRAVGGHDGGTGSVKGEGTGRRTVAHQTPAAVVDLQIDVLQRQRAGSMDAVKGDGVVFMRQGQNGHGLPFRADRQRAKAVDDRGVGIVIFQVGSQDRVTVHTNDQAIDAAVDHGTKLVDRPAGPDRFRVVNAGDVQRVGAGIKGEDTRTADIVQIIGTDAGVVDDQIVDRLAGDLQVRAGGVAPDGVDNHGAVLLAGVSRGDVGAIRQCDAAGKAGDRGVKRADFDLRLVQPQRLPHVAGGKAPGDIGDVQHTLLHGERRLIGADEEHTAAVVPGIFGVLQRKIAAAGEKQVSRGADQRGLRGAAAVGQHGGVRHVHHQGIEIAVDQHVCRSGVIAGDGQGVVAVKGEDAVGEHVGAVQVGDGRSIDHQVVTGFNADG